MDFMHGIVQALMDTGGFDTSGTESNSLTRGDWWIGVVMIAGGLLSIVLSRRIYAWGERLDIKCRRFSEWLGEKYDEKTGKPVFRIPEVVHVWTLRSLGAFSVLFGIIFFIAAILSDID